MNCLLGVLGKIFKHSFAASCQQTTAPSDHWNHFIPNVNNINLFRCWPARYSPFKQKQGNNDVGCHSFILKWTCTTSVSFLQVWRLSDSRLYTLHLFLKSYHDIAPKKHLLEGIGVPGKIHGSIISCHSGFGWCFEKEHNIIRREKKNMFFQCFWNHYEQKKVGLARPISTRPRN